ncbi:hypothetical protein BDW74DRAFT_111482 [Aspergillus multicolor]|uniref:uncharacterized protein n=1 Tax=Aspergillus multicolor TaxID=41759 RepID=UPI003CCE224E
MANSTRRCYFPNGVQAESNVPCSGEEYTSCCDYRDLCMSNGLCLATRNQPYTLSRGACTNQKWDQGCPQYCADVNPAGGCSIVNYSFRNSISRYCCGTVFGSNDSTSDTTCRDGEPFTVPDAEALPGYALLANVTSFNTSTDSGSDSSNESCSTPSSPSTATWSSSTCHETAIGAGIGVPLGVIALASVAWALWERRKRKQTIPSASLPPEQSSAAKPPGTYDGGIYAVNRKPGRMSELDSTRPVAELNA